MKELYILHKELTVPFYEKVSCTMCGIRIYVYFLSAENIRGVIACQRHLTIDMCGTADAVTATLSNVYGTTPLAPNMMRKDDYYTVQGSIPDVFPVLAEQVQRVHEVAIIIREGTHALISEFLINFIMMLPCKENVLTAMAMLPESDEYIVGNSKLFAGNMRIPREQVDRLLACGKMKHTQYAPVLTDYNQAKIVFEWDDCCLLAIYSKEIAYALQYIFVPFSALTSNVVLAFVSKSAMKSVLESIPTKLSIIDAEGKDRSGLYYGSNIDKYMQFYKIPETNRVLEIDRLYGLFMVNSMKDLNEVIVQLLPEE